MRADALSQNPSSVHTSHSDDEMQVATVNSAEAMSDFLQNMEVEELLAENPSTEPVISSDCVEEKKKNPHLSVLLSYLEQGDLPEDLKYTQQIVAKATLFAVIEGVLYLWIQNNITESVQLNPSISRNLSFKSHGGPMSGHFSGAQQYSLLSRS